MANEEHLAILKNGVKKWNRWREKNPGERPDLSGAQLRKANLSGAGASPFGADLSRADLSDADLSDANLSRANLNGACLIGADLSSAHLISANMSDADLTGAHLVCANLNGADLNGANLVCAILTDADLSSANLSSAKLSDAYLREAGLTGANLSEAYLGEAYLRVANLRGADLSGTYLNSADLRDADLSGAELRGAELRSANLSRADLSEADLSGANLGSTMFANVDLSEALSLEEVNHHGPSSLATDTLTKSKGKIPDSFLRGCGLTDWEIKAAELWDPDLTRDERTEIAYEVVNLQAESPIVLHHVFISYSRDDSRFVEKLEAGLNKKRIRYWRDVHDMKAGRMERQIEKAIRVNPLVLLVLSERSVESDWVEWECSKARGLEKQEDRDVLCPIALDDAWKTCDWPGPLRRQVMDYNILDFSDPERFDQQFEKLVGGIVENYPRG